MNDDERAIRELVETWMAATRAGNTATVLELIADDAIFMTCGAAPFGKDVFRAASESLGQVKMDGHADIREMHIGGDWAWVRNHIEISLASGTEDPVRRSGDTLTILRKDADGRWRVQRDANFVR